MKSVHIRQKVEKGLHFDLIRPAEILVDGVVAERLHYIKIEKERGEPATVTLTFTPEELTIEGDFTE